MSTFVSSIYIYIYILYDFDFLLTNISVHFDFCNIWFSRQKISVYILIFMKNDYSIWDDSDRIE